MLQQLPELLERAVAAIAGIAVTNRVAAIAGIAVVTTGLQQSLGLLLRTRSCGKCWPCRSKALRQKLETAVYNGL